MHAGCSVPIQHRYKNDYSSLCVRPIIIMGIYAVGGDVTKTVGQVLKHWKIQKALIDRMMSVVDDFGEVASSKQLFIPILKMRVAESTNQGNDLRPEKSRKRHRGLRTQVGETYCNMAT
mmetsp:Transcript_17022/g.24728  ORF Transcript_17022/g.24728 Transcript_17022/m.24728 type:complete len:119 (+) Transcript_17022:147-503(+)